MERQRIAGLDPIAEGGTQIHQRIAHGGHLPVQQPSDARGIVRIYQNVVQLVVVMNQRRSRFGGHFGGQPLRGLVHGRHILGLRIFPSLAPAFDLTADVAFGPPEIG